MIELLAEHLVQGQLTTMLLNFCKLINFCCPRLIAKPTFLESRLIFTHEKKAGVKYSNHYSTYRFLKSAQLHLIKIYLFSILLYILQYIIKYILYILQYI